MENENQLPHFEITRKIIGCAMKVHSALGNGFQEVIYQRALELEFLVCDIDHAREFEMQSFIVSNK